MLTVLGRLDPSRKEAVMEFLGEAKLIRKVEGRKPIISLSGANLSHTNLGNLNLIGANLSGANLSGANLEGGYLYRANLSEADLSNANLEDVYAEEADLGAADLSGSDMFYASLNDATLAGANLSDANLREATLHDADLINANLSDANLRNVNLRDALLQANLSHADLRNATLTGARLYAADLSHTNLSDADLSDATLQNANLQDARGITQEELEKQAKDLTGSTMPTGQIFTVFEPAFAFEIGEDWELQPPEKPDWRFLLEITWRVGGQLLFVNPIHVFDSRNLSDPKKRPEPVNAKEWVSWFQSHPNLHTSKPVPVSVGGASGMRIDVTASSTPENYPKDLCGGQPCVPLFKGSTDESMTVSAEGWKDRFAIVDVGGETVVIDVAAPADRFDAVLPKAQEVLDSVEWKSENSGRS
jgi:uncharacterized protein YjbI with pentapeptide repeats